MDLKHFKARYEHVKVQEHQNNVSENPMVSICVQTYQHVDYIKACLDGILNQETNFSIEVLLGEDSSTDGTREICIEYAKKHPEKIRLFLHHRENNIFIEEKPSGRFNFMFNLLSARGKYIALCEGDDYWTDPLKLQKQVDFLEENKNYSGVATNSLIKFEGTDKERLFRTNLKSILETNDLLEARHFHTATFMYRREAFKPDFPVNVLSADRTLFMLVSCIGPIRLLDDVTAVYRKNDGGISTKVTSKQMKQDYKIVDYIKKYSNDFDSLKLKIFITKTVLEYSHKIYF